MKLSQKQRDELWGEDGPYSQVNIIVQTRILDDRVSREFVEVEAEINPLTFKIVEQNSDKFKDDAMIRQILDNADYRGVSLGYVVSAYSKEYQNEKVMQEANAVAEYVKGRVIKMHKFVIDLFGITHAE